MVLSRRIVGARRPTFSVTNRRPAGMAQVVTPTGPNVPGRPETQGTTAPTILPPAPSFDNQYVPFTGRYDSGTALGHRELSEMSWLDRLSNWWNADEQQVIGRGLVGDIDTSINSSYGTGIRPGDSGYVSAGDRLAAEAAAYNESERVQSGQYQPLLGGSLLSGSENPLTDRGPYGPAYEGALTEPSLPWSEADLSADQRLIDRVQRNIVSDYAVGADEIRAAVDTSIADFRTERAMLEANKRQALADGQAEAAERYDLQIRDIERNIQDMEDEIALTNDIEGWYRRRIEGPYERARQAALDTEIEQTLAVQQKYKDENLNALAETEARLEGVLGDLGFTPEGIEAMRSERAEDNEVTAAQSALLEASGVRRGELDWQKKLNVAVVDEELMRSNRESSGRQMVVAAQNRDAIADARDDIAELDKLKGDALARVKRAVDREFQGAEFPEQDEFIGAAMQAISRDLMGDLPPNVQEFYTSAADYFIGNGLAVTEQNLVEAVLNGAIEIEESAAINALYKQTRDDVRDVESTDGLTPEEAEQLAGQLWAEYEAQARELARSGFDIDDKAILKGLTRTYNEAVDEYARYQEQRSRTNYSNAENRDPQNIADAKAGTGAYGIRAEIVRNMVPQIEQMWGVGAGGRVREIQGQNYFRPVPTEKVPGQSMNSDHQTAGALDLFLDVNNAEDMRFYNEVMVPQLKRWQNQGVVSSWVGLGANSAHDDHVHVSFALPGMNDQGFDPFRTASDSNNQADQAFNDQGTLADFRGGM